MPTPHDPILELGDSEKSSRNPALNPRNPYLTVDTIIEVGTQIVLIERANEPRGLALPGGFVDYGEACPEAARREAREETTLEVELTELLGVYSDPARDPRQHNVSVVYVASASGEPEGQDDAKRAFLIAPQKIDLSLLVFDHARIVADYLNWKKTGQRPAPSSANRWT